MRNHVQLINYVDRFGSNLAGLKSLLENELRGLFGGVHLLPFFDPVDGADAGFDPVDHRRVDPRLGDWTDVAALSAGYSIMADLIVNHVSADSPQFLDVRKHGRQSRYWDLFLRKGDVFPDEEPAAATAAEVKRIYRPRPGQPFTPITLDDGTAFDFWTTFSRQQLDINVEVPAGRDYLESILDTFAAAGIREIRLDAAGYAIKRRGTTCFMLPETFEFIESLSTSALERGIETLVEIHSHYQTQIEIASRVGRVYDFALPPLVLHTLYNGSAASLTSWLKVAPRNCVTVLDTHDGIGIVDVARQGDVAGLLDDKEIDSLVETIHDKTAGASRRASGQAASNLDIYQVNSTYYDALGRSGRDYLIARAIQLFAPGTPQVYYVGLLAGENDLPLLERTGVGRDVNRHYYTRQEIHAALERPVVADLMQLIRLRNEAPAFGGRFSIEDSPDDELIMRWDLADAHARLHVRLRAREATIELSTAGRAQRLTISDALLSAAA